MATLCQNSALTFSYSNNVEHDEGRGGGNALIFSPNLLLSPQEIEKPSFYRLSYSNEERNPLNLNFLRERRHTLSRSFSEVSEADELMP
jgi:hypothetical protein